MAKKLKKAVSRGSVNNIILEILNEGEKYGYEIIKEVEEKTDGKIILKQPSLYSSLSRFESKGYVSSFWQDSDIGGKRHYYKLTPSGLQAYQSLKNKNSNQKEFSNEPIENNTTENLNNSKNTTSLYDIDESNLSDDIFINDSTIKLKNYSNFDVSEKINSLLNSNPDSTLPTTNNSENTYNISDNSTEINESSSINKNIENKDTSCDDILNYQENLNENLLVDKPQIVKSSFNSNEPQLDSKNLYSNNLTNTINELNYQIETEKNKNINNESNNNLKDLYYEYKSKRDSNKQNEIKHTPLTHLEQLKKMESMEILYGNPTNYYYPSDTQKTITQNEEQINIDEFIKLKSSINSKKRVYNKNSKFIKKEKPYIFKTIFYIQSNKSKTPNNINKENDFNKVKYEFDEFGIMKIITENESTINKEQDQIFDNVKVRVSNNYLNPKDFNSYKTTSIKNSNEQTLSEDEIIKRNQEFNKRFDEISKQLFDLKQEQTNESLNENQNLINQKLSELAKLEELNSSDNEITSLNTTENNVDEFIDFETNEENNQEEITNNLNPQLKENFESNLSQNTLIQTTNNKIKSYGKINSFDSSTSKYISINKLKFCFGIIFAILLISQITALMLILKKNNLITNNDKNLYIIAYSLCFITSLFFVLPAVFNRNKKIENNFNFAYAIIFSSLSFVIIGIITYAINTLIGFNFSNIKDYCTSIILPIIYGFNILISPVIYFLLSKNKQFYK